LRFERLEVRQLLAADFPALLDVDADHGVAPAATPGTGEIRGFKWSDTDGDGVRDANEPGLAGVTIYLDENDNGELDAGEMSTVTATDNPATPANETGEYAIVGIGPDDYIVREIVPTGYEQTYPLARVSEFNIEIRFTDSSLTPAQQAVFTAAAERWQEIILGDVPGVVVPGEGLVDDLIIEASAPAIDGPGGILGQAGPTVLRTGTSLPAFGVMAFDSADVTNLVNQGRFQDVILHEMGHVLGIGTIWDNLGLLAGAGSNNPRFLGPQAIAEYNEIFNNNAASVPVENTGGSGTRDSHWSEEIFDNELMTGFLNSGVTNPISRITVGQLADIGYEVDLDAADPYTPPNLAARTGPSVTLGRMETLDVRPVYVDAAPAALASVAAADAGFWRVELGNGEIIDDVDFGNMPLPAAIRGRVWNDRDADGVQDEAEPGLPDWTVFIDEDDDGVFDHGSGTFESTDVPQPIADLGDAESDVTIALAGRIVDINVTLNITHTYDSDLQISLVSPAGTRVTLAASNGGPGNNFTNTTFDDQAATSITGGSAPFTGSFRPREKLSLFNGELAAGVWTLEVEDVIALDEGALNSWSITIATGERSVQTDAEGDYAFEDLPAGEYTVVSEPRENWLQTFPTAPPAYTVVLTPGLELEGRNFGHRAGAIGGIVWSDFDADGQIDAGEPPLPNWQVFLDLNDNGQYDKGVTTIASPGAPQAISNNSTITSQIVVANLGVLDDLDITLNIEHEYDADLDVFLISPSGVRVELFTDVGSFRENFTNTVLNDEAATSITAGTAPFTGSYRPEGSLAAFDGVSANGTWTLEITDDSSLDLGTLLNWSLHISASEPLAVTDEDGVYKFPDLAAGRHIVADVLELGWSPTLPVGGRREFQLAVGAVVEDANFGNRSPSLGGRAWNDRDVDGIRDAGELPLAGYTVYLDANGNGAFDDSPVDYLSTSPTLPIPDLGLIGTTIQVNSQLPIDDVDVTLSIVHADIADLDVFLVSPAGTRLELFTDLASGTGLSATTLDDEASSSIVVGSTPFSGAYRPEGSLADFDDENPFGLWTLEVRDDAGNDVGSLLSWSLTITAAEASATTDADGRYEFLNLTPGSHTVRSSPNAMWTPTFPAGGAGHTVNLSVGQHLANLDFGARSNIFFGDFDRDDDVDGNDFLVWQRTLGATASPAGSGADGDGDGVVAAGDLAAWRANYGVDPGVAPSVVAAGDDAEPAARDAAFAQLAGLTIDGPGLAGATSAGLRPSARAAFRPRMRAI
jgi:subtilisin-like proprotein convertase family protein